RHLRLLYGFPLCQQELSKDSCRISGSTALTAPCDVQLSLWPWNQQEVADELTWEFSRGRVETVRSLLAAGANMELAAACRTALMHDSDGSYIELVRLLVEARSKRDV
ncbi:RH47, partial [Symbiodinium pilosum]